MEHNNVSRNVQIFGIAKKFLFFLGTKSRTRLLLFLEGNNDGA